MVVQEPRETGGREVLRFGPFEANLPEWELRRNGRPVRLQGQPFQILARLLAHPGELVSRDDLRRELWPDHTFVDFDRSLNKAINKLRNTLFDDAERPRYIATVPRHGYRFIAPVEAAPPSHPRQSAANPPHPDAVLPAASGPRSQALAPPSVPAVPLAGVSNAPPPGAPAPRPMRLAVAAGRRRAAWVTAAVLGFAIAGVGWLAAGRWPFGRGARLPGPAPRLAVAVLGFHNLSARPHTDWLATALSDWLTTELAAGHQLRLVPQQGVARMRTELHLPLGESLTARSLARVRRDSGADLVVAGSYALLGPRATGPMRLDLLVQDTRTGATLLALHQNGVAAQLLTLVARAGARLRAGLGIVPVTAAQAEEVRRESPATPAGVRDYAEGLAHLRVFDAIAARRWLLRAVAADPKDALAHSALSTAWRILGYDHQALAEAAEALRLSPGLNRRQRLLLQARYDELSRHWRRAIAIYRALCRFFPDNVEYALALAHARTRAGQGRQALAGLRRLATRGKVGAPPPDPRLELAVASAQESLGDYRGMRRAAERGAAEARANGASLLLARALSDEAWAEENLGEISGALAIADRARRRYATDGDDDGVAAALTLQAIGASDAGQSRQALGVFRRALTIYQRTGRQDSIAAEWNNVGSMEEDLGQLSPALRHYRRARTIYAALEHRDGVALTTANVAGDELALGRTAAAVRNFRTALALCRRVGDRSKAALARFGLARADYENGEWVAAGRNARRSMAAFLAIGDRRSAAKLMVLEARVGLNQRDFGAAQREAAAAAAEFRREGVAAPEATALATDAQALWGLGERARAEAQMRRAQLLVRGSERVPERLDVALAAAQLAAMAGRPRARPRLENVAAQAQRLGFAWPARQARLALSALGTASGRIVAKPFRRLTPPAGSKVTGPPSSSSPTGARRIAEHAVH